MKFKSILISTGLTILFLNPHIIAVIIAIFFLIAYIVYEIIKGINFSKRTFKCLMCGNHFKPKWYRLAFLYWRTPRKTRVYKELDTETYEKVTYKCPECKSWECAVKCDKVSYVREIFNNISFKNER